MSSFDSNFDLDLALRHPQWVEYRNGDKVTDWHYSKVNKAIISFPSSGSIKIHSVDGKNNKHPFHDLILNIPPITEEYHIVRRRVGPPSIYRMKSEAAKELLEFPDATIHTITIQAQRQ